MNNFIATITYHNNNFPVQAFKFNDKNDRIVICDIPYSHTSAKFLIVHVCNYTTYIFNDNELYIRVQIPLDEITSVTFF